MIRLAKLTFFVGVALSSFVRADDFSTHSEFSYNNTKGNTNTSALVFDGNARQSWDIDDVRLHVDARRSTSNGDVLTDKWSSELDYDHKLDHKWSFNYLAGYRSDRFSGYHYQYYTGPGLGYDVIKNQEDTLNFQGNILYSVDKPDNDIEKSYASTKLGVLYTHQIYENLKFVEYANYRLNLQSTNHWFVYSKTGLESKINQVLSIGMNYKIDYVNLPPLAAKSMDRIFLITVIMDF